MSDFSAKVEGLPELHKKLMSLPVNIKKMITKAVDISALDIQNDIRSSMAREAKSGRTYKRRKGRSTKKGTRIKKKGAEKMFHQASAPGQAPAVDSGRLVNHVTYKTDVDGLGASIGVTDAASLEYAVPLEFGTKHMLARPWLQPGFDRNKKKVTERMEKAVDDAIRKSKGDK
jgi:HK97 gp10 family phage protein